MADIAATTVKTAKGVKPNITLVLKPRNWYDEYQFSGFNMAGEPKLFDMIYTGNETRDAENTVQYLQSYQSFDLVRYFEHLKPVPLLRTASNEGVRGLESRSAVLLRRKGGVVALTRRHAAPSQSLRPSVEKA